MPESLAGLVDLSLTGPWLALLWLLVAGLGMPMALMEALDRWAESRRHIDRVALATRYGGFMNSWAVFGRGATDYRDVRPLFPGAQAAELARFSDQTACLAARYADADEARRQAHDRLGGFAAAGIEFDGAGLRFKAGDAGRLGRWLVVEDTLLAFYGPTPQAIRERQRQTPALIVRPLPNPFSLLRTRTGFSLVAVVWLVLNLGFVTLLLEQGLAQAPPPAAARVSPEELTKLLARDGRRITGDGLIFRIDPPPPPPHQRDLALINDRDGGYQHSVRIRLDPATATVQALLLYGPPADAEGAGDWLPQRVNLGGLLGADSEFLRQIRAAVLDAGWRWQPRLWPFRF